MRKNDKRAKENNQENIQSLKDRLGVGISFDVIHSDLNYDERDMAIFLLMDLLNKIFFTYHEIAYPLKARRYS